MRQEKGVDTYHGIPFTTRALEEFLPPFGEFFAKGVIKITLQTFFNTNINFSREMAGLYQKFKLNCRRTALSRMLSTALAPSQIQPKFHCKFQGT